MNVEKSKKVGMPVTAIAALSTITVGDTFDDGSGVIFLRTSGPADAGKIGVVSLSNGNYTQVDETLSVHPHAYKAVPV